MLKITSALEAADLKRSWIKPTNLTKVSNDDLNKVKICEGFIEHIWVALQTPYLLVATRLNQTLHCQIINHELNKVLEGEIMLTNISLDPLPCFNSMPKEDNSSINQFDACIYYEKFDENSSAIYKKSFQTNEETLVKSYTNGETIIDFFLIQEHIMVIQFDKKKFEIFNTKTEKIISTQTIPIDKLQSNKKLKDLVFMPAFSKSDTFLFMFSYSNDKLRSRPVNPILIKPNIFIYQIPIRKNYDSFIQILFDRLYTIEYQLLNDSDVTNKINENFNVERLRWYRHDDDDDDYYYALDHRNRGTWSQNNVFCFVSHPTSFDNEHVYVHQIRNDFKMSINKVEIKSLKRNYPYLDFFDKNILVQTRNGIYSYYLDLSETKLENGIFVGSEFDDSLKILSNGGKVLKYHYNKYIQENSLAKTLISLKKIWFTELGSNVVKVNFEDSVFDFIDEENFLSKSDDKIAIINAASGETKFELENKFKNDNPQFLSKHFVVFDKLFYFIHDINQAKITFEVMSEFDIEKIFIVDNGAKELFCINTSNDFLFIYRVWFDTETNALLSKNIAKIEQRCLDYTLVNQQYLVLIMENSIKCQNIKDTTAPVIEIELIELDLPAFNSSTKPKSIKLEPIEKSNQFFIHGLFNNSYVLNKSYWVEITSTLTAKLEFAYKNKLLVKGNICCWRYDNRNVVVYDLERDDELLRINIGIEIKDIILSANKRHFLTIHQFEIRLYDLKDSILCAKLPINDNVFDGLIMSSRFIIKMNKYSKDYNVFDLSLI